MKKWFVIGLSLMLVLVLTACGQNKENKAGDSKKLKDVTIMLDWYPNAVHSFIYAAQEKGYFKKEGLNVKVQFPANPTDSLNLAAAGKVTLGLYYQPDVAMARANEDVPVKSVGAIVRSPLNRVVALKDSGITRPKDLEGKVVGYSGTPLSESVLKKMVKSDGGDPNKVKLVDVGFELNSSLISKKVDAVIGAYINHEVPLLHKKGYKTVDIDPSDYGVPSYYELVAVTGDQTWAKDSDTIKAFWRAATKGYEYTEKHPKESLQILLDNQDKSNFPLEKDVETKSLNILLPKMKSEHGFGSQTKESWQSNVDWLKESGLIKKKPNVDEMFENIGESK
jgi:putative hydroxymethylpyrimidine transport system substrate-binding protein